MPYIKHTITIEADAAYYVQGINADYATARSTAMSFSNTDAEVGQSGLFGNYFVWRSFLRFDTSAIPATAVVTNAALTLTCVNDLSDTDFDVQVVAQDWSAQDPIGAGNMQAAYENCLAGAQEALWRNTAGIAVNTPYVSGDLDAARINKLGYTYYSLRSSRDENADAPAGSERVVLGFIDDATPAYRPQLTIEYGVWRSWRTEDIQRELVTLSDASCVVIEPTEVLTETGVLVAGATRHKLESAQLTVLGEVRGVGTEVGNALSWDEPQAIRWIPNQDEDKEWWGIILKQTRGYDAAGRDRVAFAVLKDPGHALLHSRAVGLKGPEAAAVGAHGDDVAKALVTSSFSGAVGGVSLAWDHAGTLAVAADTSEAGQVSVATEWEDRWLDEVLDELAEEYGFDWELKPSVSGSDITWTLETKAPRGGVDRTSGANRVVIDGFAGSAPAGERFVDRTGMVNAWTDKGKALARTLAASVAKWGTWFGVSGSETVENLDIDLELSREQEGSAWTYVAQALQGECDWLTHFDVGDLVLKANAKTGEAEAEAEIEALEWSWQNGLFRPQLRFGDGKPTLSKKQKEKGGGKGGGRGGSGRGVPKKNEFEDEDDQIAPIAGDSEAGSIDKWPRVDHRHAAAIQVDDGRVGPDDDGEWTFQSTDASVEIEIGSDAFSVDFRVTATGQTAAFVQAGEPAPTWVGQLWLKI